MFKIQIITKSAPQKTLIISIYRDHNIYSSSKHNTSKAEKTSWFH